MGNSKSPNILYLMDSPLDSPFFIDDLLVVGRNQSASMGSNLVVQPSTGKHLASYYLHMPPSFE
jgi:hypothetical protein